MPLKTRAGQSTLEYTIILAVVAAAIVGAATIFKPQLGKTYNYVCSPTSNTTSNVGPTWSTGGGASSHPYPHLPQ